jgi:adenosylcobyric acid synthase
VTALSEARGSVMVCGTASNTGKSLLVAGLCRLLSRQGVRVAPFKGQNMALNSIVTADGDEIGRAQGAQAQAASVEPESAMNPVLLKPTSDRRSQVIVMGRPWRTLDAADFHVAKAELVGVVDGALADLRRRFDVVICEGAGSPAEINLLGNDLVNLGLAGRANVPAILVGDIDRGGVFAHLYGTTALLPDALRSSLRAFVINKFRGDPALLGDATSVLEERTGLPTLGVVPWLDDVAIDAEDSLALAELERRSAAADQPAGALEVAVVRLPRISNFTDLDALSLEPGVSVRWARHVDALLGADLVILPGTKSTVADLAWLRERGFDRMILELLAGPAPPSVLGLCGGYQMLGKAIADGDGVEHDGGDAPGLGLLDVATRFVAAKQTARRAGRELDGATAVAGYQIHHGRVAAGPSARAWFALDGPDGDEEEGARDDGRAIFGTTLHGLFEGDAFRARFLAAVAARRAKEWAPSGISFAAARAAQYDRVADACEAHLDVDALLRIVAEGALS